MTFENGYSRKPRYLRKNQRISIAFVTDALKAIMTNVTRVDPKGNNADIHTKPLSTILFNKHKADLGVKWCDSAAQPSVATPEPGHREPRSRGNTQCVC